MTARRLHHALVIALFAVAPVAAAQSAATPGTGTDTTTKSAATSGKHDASMSHKATHQGSGARPHKHKDSAGATHATSGMGNAQYDAALRRCVQMNGNERERCLDEAISRYGS